MNEGKLTIMIVDTFRPGKEGVIERIITEKLIPGLRRQLPEFRWRIYRPLIGGNMSKLILLASVTAQQLLNYDEWIITALEKEHGKEESGRYLQEWYESLVSSEYTALVEKREWSNL